MYILDLSVIQVLLSMSTVIFALPLDSLTHDVPEALQARASYSVVPVNGGSTTAAPTSPMTVIETVTNSIIKTATVITPPTTETAVSIETVQASATPTTVSITVSISDPEPPEPTETIIITAPQSLSSISTPTSPVMVSLPATARESSMTPTSTSSSTTTPTISSEPTVTSTSHTYDNGQWHTTYPSWNTTTMSTYVLTGSITSSYAAAPSGGFLKR